MGCDIHLFVEKKIYNIIGFEKKEYWISIDKWTKNEYFHFYPNEPEWEVSIENEMYSKRNYFLFSILANVRNKDNSIIPISIPRGLPDDVTKEIKILSDYEGADGHSHSWLSVKEILEYNWNQEYFKDGKKYLYRDICSEFIDGFIPELLKIADPKDLRIVFWFDN